MVQKIGRGGNEGGEGKEEKEEEEEEEEEEEKEEDEEEDEEDEEEDEEDEQEDEQEDEAKRREERREGRRGGGKGGGESVENLVRGDSFKAKAEAKPKQSKIHKTRRQAGGFDDMIKDDKHTHKRQTLCYLYLILDIIEDRSYDLFRLVVEKTNKNQIKRCHPRPGLLSLHRSLSADRRRNRAVLFSKGVPWSNNVGFAMFCMVLPQKQRLSLLSRKKCTLDHLGSLSSAMSELLISIEYVRIEEKTHILVSTHECLLRAMFPTS